jgi:hypothetical protein
VSRKFYIDAAGCCRAGAARVVSCSVSVNRPALFGTTLAVTALSLVVWAAPAGARAPVAADLGVTASDANGRAGQVVDARYTVTNRGKSAVAGADVTIEILAPSNGELANVERLYPSERCEVVKPKRQVRCRGGNVAFYQPNQPSSASIPILVTGTGASDGFVRVTYAGDPIAVNNTARYTVTSLSGPSTGPPPTSTAKSPSASRSATPRASGSPTASASEEPFALGAGDTGGPSDESTVDSATKQASTSSFSPLIWVGVAVIVIALGLIASLFVLRRRDRREDEDAAPAM